MSSPAEPVITIVEHSSEKKDLILRIEDLYVNFYTYDGIVRAIDGVFLTIQEGETYGLVGETGCGKSVTARAVMRLIPDPPGRITRGHVWFRGDDLLDGIENEAIIEEREHGAKIRRNKSLIKKNDAWMQSIRGNGISMIFQEPMSALNPVFTIGDQLSEVFLLHRRKEMLDLVFKAWTPEGVKEGVEAWIKSSPELNNKVKSIDVEGNRIKITCPSREDAQKLHHELKKGVRSARRYNIYMRQIRTLQFSGNDILITLRRVNPLIRRSYKKLHALEGIKAEMRGFKSALRREVQRIKLELKGKASEDELRESGDDVARLCELAKKYNIPQGEILSLAETVQKYERKIFWMELPERVTRRWFKGVHRWVLSQMMTAALGESLRMLRLVNVPHPDRILEMYPFELSGGMQQRAMIAMALSCNPALLIADEPSTALDVTIQAQILELMKELKRKIGTSILLITHDLGVVAEMCSRVGVMYGGTIVEEGTVDEIFENPKHPYTRGLITSIPKIDRKTERLAIIPGSVPNLINPPTGCRFHPRCQFAMVGCTKHKPADTYLTRTHRVACFLYQEGLTPEERLPLKKEAEKEVEAR